MTYEDSEQNLPKYINANNGVLRKFKSLDVCSRVLSKELIRLTKRLILKCIPGAVCFVCLFVCFFLCRIV